MPTVASALERGVELLQASNESASADARLLLGHVLGCDRPALLTHGERELDEAQHERFLAACERRAAGTPVAYILGTAGFYGRTFTVNEHVLIPRPETEQLVEAGVAHLRARRAMSARALDVGVGSGAIACTVAAEVEGALVDGIDVSRSAVAIARRNARRLGVHARCTFVVADLANVCEAVADSGARRYDLVTANLPYVPTAQLPRSPDPVSFEPRLALDGGSDGLDCYRALLPRLPALVARCALVLLEAAPPTASLLADLAALAFPRASAEVRKDYAGLDRIVVLTT